MIMQASVKRSKLKRLLGSTSFTPFVTLLLLFALFSILAPRFSMLWNVRLIVKQSAINGILGIALFLIVLTGGIDVSIGANLSLICTLTGMMSAAGVPFMGILIADILAGGLVGYLMGALVTRLHLPDLIVTLAAKNLIRGIALMLCQRSYTVFPEEIIFLGSKSMFGGKVPTAFVCFLVIAIFMAVLMQRTKFGKNIYAIGGNPVGAVQAGIHVEKTRRKLYALEGTLVGVASILYCGMYKSVLASKIGADTVNSLLAIVLLGGASMSGGNGKILGIAFGALIMAVVNNGMILAKSTDYWITALTGFIILAAMLLQFMQKRRRK